MLQRGIAKVCPRADNVAMKPLEEMTFTDDFMFGWIIQHNDEICRKMLECLLGIRINRIGYLNSQEREQSTYMSKAVCFDVYADDGVYLMWKCKQPRKVLWLKGRGTTSLS